MRRDYEKKERKKRDSLLVRLDHIERRNVYVTIVRRRTEHIICICVCKHPAND